MPTPTRADSLLSLCVLVIKTPVASRERVADRLGDRRRLAGQVENAALEQERTLDTLQEALARRGVTPVTVSVDAIDARARRALAAARLVISVGGDGTLLTASHWITGAALLGVNSAPRSSVGYLTSTRRSTLARDPGADRAGDPVAASGRPHRGRDRGHGGCHRRSTMFW